jgi:CRISPR-associated endonuclease Csn1
MSRILGLDLGSTSIGWAIVEENSNEILSEDNSATSTEKDRIVAMGSRIIPYTGDEGDQFAKGQAITINADRTQKRTARKGYDRYQLRRALLLAELRKLGMYSGTTLKCSTLQLWGLRAKGVDQQLSLLELGRVLCHINQKRGYRTTKSDFSDKQQSAYVNTVVGRYRELQELQQTIGQYMYTHLVADSAFRCKDLVYPRDAYVEEFDAILSCQQQFYPDILTPAVVAHLRDYIIFYQRPLKSCKHLVAKCELERHDVELNGRVRNCGPRVAPRSSPLFQLCKIWETVNNLTIRNKYDESLNITPEQRQAIVDFMNTHEKLKTTDLKNLLHIKSKEWLLGKSVGTGLQGNTTYCTLAKALSDTSVDSEALLRFQPHIIDREVANPTTGEVLKQVDPSFEQQPLYRLWHAIYSIADSAELRTVLKEKFGIADDQALDALCRIDFVKSGYSNKSSRAMRKILPYLQEGKQYFEAKCMAGYTDTTLTTEQNKERLLADALPLIPKGELRQPVVEKVLNQLVNLVNAIIKEYGRPDEVRIELARELKQSREEREAAEKAINQNRRDNEQIAKRITDEYHLQPTRLRIQKYRMWEESKNCCIYCGAIVNVTEFLQGSGVEVEHIIPRSVRFDDSFSNKACACRSCNQSKGNQTARDFMESRGEAELEDYVTRVNQLADEKRISRTKQRNLLTPLTELPQDFIERQLRESQYIAKKAKKMLQTVCRNVYATSGSITDFLRHTWGWDDVLHQLNLPRYRDAGLTDWVSREEGGQIHEVERIHNWSKRMDHRHHAVDALTIACTKQRYIQRINNLNSLKEVSFHPISSDKQGEATQQRLTRLERYIRMQSHFSTAEVAQAVSTVAVSFKGGKRAAGIGKRYIYKNGKRICAQSHVIIPRGALSKESVYGHINKGKDTEKTVLKYALSSITSLRDVEYVIDKRIREILRTRLEAFDGNAKKAFAEAVYDHQGRAIRSVRCYTGLDSDVPLHYNEQGEPISFVVPGNNHHVAIYEDANGVWYEHIVTFWHAVERKKYGIPVIIVHPDEVWNSVTDTLPESFQNQLPESPMWHLKFSMQQNEMFILGMDDDAYAEAIRQGDNATLSRYLYRIQKLSAGYYVFRHHLETTVDDKYDGNKNANLSIKMRKMIRISSMKAFMQQHPHKVRVSITGHIVDA